MMNWSTNGSKTSGGKKAGPQTQAGDAIGAGRGAWQQWELRKRTPSDTALIAASYIFNVSLPYICGVDDEPTPQSMIIPESATADGP